MKLQMKKILLLLSVTALMVSCKKTGENEYIITGTVTGIENGKTVILQKQDDETMGKMVSVDTVKIENGKFEIKGTATEPAIHILKFETKPGQIDFVLENGEINVAVDKDTIAKSKVTGTYNNEELTKFKTDMQVIQKDLQKKAMAFQEANMQKMTAAQQTKDTVVINQLMKEYAKIQEPLTQKYYTYAEGNPKSFISVLITQSLFNMPEPDFAKIKKIYDGLTSELKNTKPGKAIKEKLDNREAVQVGKKAPDFSAKTPDGKTVSLKESLGKVTIIDFWASWCGPCRQENPNVVALYNEFHDKGLNIVGVSLDREGEAESWKKAIEADKLTWTHVSNLKFWQDPIAKKYNITSIPATFILDASGKIVAKDLRGEELKAKVKELLGA
ncbi:Thiol-disulfide oxidoreductase ResA [compost metagenome]